jgi:hypothetical protein
MILKVGDKVSFLNEKGGGIIIKYIDSLTVSVEIEQGIEIPYAVSQLIFDDEIQKDNIGKNSWRGIQNKKQVDFKFNTKSKPHIKNDKSKESIIDLHIEEIVNEHGRMQNYEIVQLQLVKLHKSLTKAIRNNTRSLVIIHGVGNGRLKEEVWKALADYPKITYHEASYSLYGLGATEVILF